jgi:hypothetical protein
MRRHSFQRSIESLFAFIAAEFMGGGFEAN